MLVVGAAVATYTDSRLLTMLDAHVGGPWLSIVITVLWIVVITNAFNMLDNMDGLSGGIAAICAACFLVTALVNARRSGSSRRRWCCCSGRCLGFWSSTFRGCRAGRPPTARRGGASVFMGDGGSLVIGFLLAVLSVRITYVPAHHRSRRTCC